MAQMVPPTISPDIKSNAEKKIFQYFKDSPDTKGWIVLHSLGIANHAKNLIGEVDFCVLAPQHGVFALEVKGGRVSQENGQWKFTNRYGETSIKTRGPFEQAREGAFSILNAIRERKSASFHHLNNLHFGYGVMFPDINFDVNSVEYDLWQVFDKSDTNQVGRFIRDLSKKFIKKKINTYNYFDEKTLPSKKDINHIKTLLRPDFDKKISLDVQIRDTEKRLIELTDEQYRLFDQLDGNPRLFVHGPAGTGKTLIALEDAKQHVREGKRVAFFCYNVNLAKWLKKNFNQSDLPDYIGTIHSFMLQCSKEAQMLDGIPSNSSKDDDFYRYVLPKISTEAVKTLDKDFDMIIIDEAQDILYEDVIQFLDRILKGGLFDGNWRFFGDFSRQSIYTNSVTLESVKKRLSEMTFYANFKLTINCRNTQHIFEEILTITSFEDETTVLKVEGIPVEHYTYNSHHEQSQKLRKILKRLINADIPPNEITILSPYKFQNSTASDINFPIKEVTNEFQNSITHSTIQGFKGLENSVIVMTDIDNIDNRKLMYVGLSRARSALYLLIAEKAQESYNTLKKERVLNNGR